jgi:hypothetical protein
MTPKKTDGAPKGRNGRRDDSRIKSNFLRRRRVAKAKNGERPPRV